MSSMISPRSRVLFFLSIVVIFLLSGCVTGSPAGRSRDQRTSSEQSGAGSTRTVAGKAQGNSSASGRENSSQDSPASAAAGSNGEEKTQNGKKTPERDTPQENGLGAPEGGDETEKALPKVVPLPKVDPVEEVLAGLTLSQKIGQRFITWLRAEGELQHVKSVIQSEQPAGVIVYPRNFRTYRDVLGATGELREAASKNAPEIGLFLCTDQEGGRVQAFHYPETFQFPAPWFWGRYEDSDFISSAAYVLGREMRTLGFNMDLAPVLDLYEKPDSTVIGDRSMGGDPERVAGYAQAYMEGLRRADVLPVAKHFPGHGVSVTDSHQRLPVSNLTEEELLSRDLIPFKAAIDDGLPVVLTGHILFPKIDEKYPVTLSEKIIQGVLREKLGFEGVVMSDAIEMGALTRSYPLKETLVRAIKAGVDLILVGSLYDLPDLVKIVETAVEKGELSESDIDDGVRRILRLKLQSGLLKKAVVIAENP